MMKPSLLSLGCLLSAGCLLGLPVSASAETYDWNKTKNNPPTATSYLWMEGANWGDGSGAGYPVAGDTANITPILEGNLTVSVSGNPLVGILNVGDSGEGLHTITIGAGGSSANLTMNASGGTAEINKTSGNLVVIEKRLYFASDTVINVAEGELRMSGGIPAFGIRRVPQTRRLDGWPSKARG